MSSSFAILDHSNAEDIAKQDIAPIRDSTFDNDSTFCQDAYSSIKACLPSWISFQNLWSTLHCCRSSDDEAISYDACRGESPSNESQPLTSPSVSELNPAAILVDAPPSLEIKSSTEPQEVDFGKNTDSLEGKYNNLDRKNSRKESSFVTKKDESMSLTPVPVFAAAPAAPELEESDALEHSNDEVQHSNSSLGEVTEYTCLKSKEDKNQVSPSKQKRNPRNSGKALLKAAVKGGKALGRVFRRRNSVMQ